MFYVIGNAGGTTSWVLNLDGYPTKEAAQRAINWQRQGQGQFDPPGYWKITEYEPPNGFVDADGYSYLPGSAPYTFAAWQAFLDRLLGDV
jgi:hypothetical protein